MEKDGERERKMEKDGEIYYTLSSCLFASPSNCPHSLDTTFPYERLIISFQFTVSVRSVIHLSVQGQCRFFVIKWSTFLLQCQTPDSSNTPLFLLRCQTPDSSNTPLFLLRCQTPDSSNTPLFLLQCQTPDSSNTPLFLLRCQTPDSYLTPLSFCYGVKHQTHI